MVARYVSVLLGIWLIIASWALPHAFAGSWANDFWTGVSIVIVALVSTNAPSFRFVNTILGAWLIVSPFVLGYVNRAPAVNDVIIGALVLVLSLVPGEVLDRYAGQSGPPVLP
jgi:hypothetical protein